MRERKLFRKAVLGTIQQKKVVKWRIIESSFNKACHKKWCILALHADDCCLECYWKPGYSTEHNAYIIWYCWQLEITGKYRLVSQRLTTYLTFAKPCSGNKSAKNSTGKYPGIWWMLILATSLNEYLLFHKIMRLRPQNFFLPQRVESGPIIFLKLESSLWWKRWLE